MEKERFTRSARVLVLACLLTTAPAGLAAQEPADLPSADFAEELAVEVVNVEVYVTDRKGRPVTGLTRDDFRLSENGDPVEIAYFSAFQGEAAPPAPAVPAEAAGEEADAPGDESTLPGREARSLVIYLDDANLATAGRRRVLADLREVVATGRDGADRIMVVIHEGGLQIAQPFTTDREAVVEVLRELEGKASSGIYRVRDHQTAYRNLKTLFRTQGEACNSVWPVLEAAARQYADQVTGDVSSAVGALSQVASALSGVSGRKFVLYVADGLEQRAGIDLFHYAGEICPWYEQEFSKNYLSYDLAPLFHKLTAHANANGVTIYTLEAGGMKVDSDVAADDPAFQPSLLTQRLRDANRQSPLFQLANDTGGRAVLNANEFAGELERIGEDYGTYYSLGFESHHRGDGQLHRIEVDVAGRGLEVRHREYYRDKPLETRLAERVWGTLLLGTETNSLGLAVTAGQSRARPVGCCSVPVEIRVPVARLSLAPGADSDVGRVYVVMTAKDAEGETISVRGREIAVRATSGEDPAAPYRTLVVDVDLAPGSWELAVGVMDLLGGGESYVRERLEVPAAPPETSGRLPVSDPVAAWAGLTARRTASRRFRSLTPRSS